MCNEFIKPNMLALLMEEHKKHDRSIMAKNDNGMMILDLILAYLFVIDASKVNQENFSRFDFNATFDTIWNTLDIVVYNKSSLILL